MLAAVFISVLVKQEQKLEDLDFMGITHFHTDHVNDLHAGGYFFDREIDLLKLLVQQQVLHSLTSTVISKADFDLTMGHTLTLLAYTMEPMAYSRSILPMLTTNHTVPTVVYEKDGLKITALGIPRGDVPCLAYRIESEEGVMVISADQNGSNPAFLDFARGADIMMMPMAIHEQADGVSSFHARETFSYRQKLPKKCQKCWCLITGWV